MNVCSEQVMVHLHISGEFRTGNCWKGITNARSLSTEDCGTSDCVRKFRCIMRALGKLLMNRGRNPHTKVINSMRI